MTLKDFLPFLRIFIENIFNLSLLFANLKLIVIVKSYMNKIIEKDSNKINIYYFLLLVLLFLFVIFTFMSVPYNLSCFFNNYLKIIDLNNTVFINLIFHIINLIFIIFFLFVIIITIKKIMEPVVLNYLKIKDTVNKTNVFYFLLYILPLFIFYFFLFIFKKYEMIDFDVEKIDIIYNYLNKDLIENRIFFNVILYVYLLYFSFSEELIFRYYMLYYIEKYYKNKLEYNKIYIYVIFTLSIIFAILHFPSTIYIFIGDFLFSLYLYNLKSKTKSIIFCMLFHFINNLLAYYFYI